MPNSPKVCRSYRYWAGVFRDTYVAVFRMYAGGPATLLICYRRSASARDCASRKYIGAKGSSLARFPGSDSGLIGKELRAKELRGRCSTKGRYGWSVADLEQVSITFVGYLSILILLYPPTLRCYIQYTTHVHETSLSCMAAMWHSLITGMR